MEYLLYAVFFIAFIATQVLENWFRERERFVGMPGAGTFWHMHQWLGWILIFGYITFLLFEDVWTGVRILILSAAIWWIFFDGWLNSLKKRWWFHQSKETSSTFEKYARMEVKLILLFIAILLLVAGCSPAVRYVDRVTVDTVVVVPPTIIKELPAVTVTDTVVIGHEIVKTDTVVTVKYFPREQRFDLMVKPDTVKLLMVDTVEVTQVLPDPEPETPIWVWFVSIGGIIGVLYIFLRKR